MAFVVMIAALLAGPTPTSIIIEPDTVHMTLREVKAFNATVDPKHRFYITCRKIEVIGSLVKGGHACRTARQWQRIEENGEREARQLIEDSRSRPGGR